jgi:NifU-like protein involved in Fe-S cluster formation
MTSTDAAQLLGPYNARVRECFNAPHHAADGNAVGGHRYAARAAESDSGAHLSLSAVTDNCVLASLRFRVFGCPHLIAAAEVCCERFEGGPVNQLGDLDVPRLMETLGVPIEKTGRILLLEDAIRSLRSQIDAESVNQD